MIKFIYDKNFGLCVGNKIKIRKDLNTRMVCESDVIFDMLTYSGKSAEIILVNEDKTLFRLDIDNGLFVWNIEMFEK